MLYRVKSLVMNTLGNKVNLYKFSRRGLRRSLSGSHSRRSRWYSNRNVHIC